MAKILLVEDDNNLREIYEARMLAEGYTVVTASDGEAALAVAAKEKPELIISDVMMPKISGFEMLDILRNTEGLKTTKVIMLTALGQAEDKTRADSLGADKYLVKSQVTLEDIVNTARGLLTEDNATPTAAPVATDAAPATPAPVGTPTPQPIAVAAPPTPAPVAPATTPVAAPTPVAVTPTPVIPVTATPSVANTPQAVTPATVPVPTPAASTTTTAGPVTTPVAIPQPAPTTPAPTVPPASEPTPTTPTPTPVTPPTNTAAIDDKIVSNAVEQLLANADQSLVEPQKPSTLPKPPAPAFTSQKPVFEDISRPTPSEPPRTVTSITGNNIEVAGKKVITPISRPETKPTLDELLAKENGEAPKRQETALDKAPDFTPPQPGVSVTPQNDNNGNFDPNSISL